MRWLIVGPYPPEQGSGAAAAAAFVAERLAAGDTVRAVSPRPTAAHEHAPLDGLRGIRVVWRLARTERADGLWLRVEPGIVLRHAVDRRRALVERAALALLLRRFDTSVLDVGDVGLLPGGRAGRPVLAVATRLVVHRPEDADILVANGASPDRIEQIGPASVADSPVAGSAVAAPPVTYPPPSALQDLRPSRDSIEAAVRDRAAELQAARSAQDEGPGRAGR